MYELSYKTRGDGDPHGKRKVYFTCHPADFDRYFADIAADIHKTQNCAVYYDPDLTVQRDDREMASHFRDMPLFVIPITTQFLRTENRARCVEFAYAIEHHIPVLPLMQEGGLEELFNRVCGNLQFLDKSNRDPTAIPYEKKLETFLSGILLGEEQIKQIRAAFDAYIFLSYRKKDRIYAQELMRLIHKNEFCRDIAIWYDEFLVPGRDFEAAIRAALDKSELFTLVVTPSLLEKNDKGEDNYIMTVEYPLATDPEHPTPVLPAEMVYTDREGMTRGYKDIPPIVDAHEATALSDALTEHLKNIAVRENDDDPRHNFFIGLAYLGGIDVEVDHERAVRLITFAAEHDLPEAMDKLVGMYRNGEGVRRDYEVMLDWLRRIANHWQRAIEQDPTEENVRQGLYAYYSLGTHAKNMGRLTEAETALTTYRNLCVQWNEHFDCRRDLSIAYSHLGSLHMAEGQVAEARDCYRREIQLARQLVKEEASARAQRDLMDCFLSIGDLEKSQQAYSVARAFYEEGLALAIDLCQADAAVENRQNLSLLHNRMGNLLYAQGHLSEAREQYERQLQIDTALYEEEKTVNFERDLAICYMNYGDVCKAEGDLSEAREWYSKCLALLSRIREETASLAADRDLIQAHRALGDLHQAMKDYEKAEICFLHMLQLAEAIVPYDEAVLAPEYVSVAYNRLGNLLLTRGRLGEAEAYYRRQREIDERLVEKTDTVKARREISVSYLNFGELYEAGADWKAAKDQYEKALELRQILFDETHSLEAHWDLSIVLVKLGDLHKKRGDYKTAGAYYTKMLAVDTAATEFDESVTSRGRLSISYNRLGSLFFEQGVYAPALDYYRKQLEIVRALAKETGSVPALRELAIGYINMGDICVGQGQLDEAIMHFTQSRDLLMDLIRKTHNVDVRNDLALAYCRLGEAHDKAKHWRTAIGIYEQSLAIRADLAKENRSYDAQFAVCVIHNRLGTALCALHRYQAARSHYLESYQLINRLADETDTPGLDRERYTSTLNMATVSLALWQFVEAVRYIWECVRIKETMAGQS